MALCPTNLLTVRKFPTYHLTYTGGSQTVTVPLGAQFMVVDLAGAQGSDCAVTPRVPGGLGGRLQAVLPVTGGATLTVNVGGQGTQNAGGFNGGANGGPTSAAHYLGGGGGGGTDIRIGGTALADRKLVAGGGGGGACPNITGYSSAGGNGGGTTGGAGHCPPLTSSTTAVAGQGGTQSAGGTGGHDEDNGHVGTAGALGVGGAANTSTGSVSGVGGGGGGGYYGGGGGGTTNGGGSGGGGGGGSSYTDGAATNVTHTQGYQPGDGYAMLSFR